MVGGGVVALAAFAASMVALVGLGAFCGDVVTGRATGGAVTAGRVVVGLAVGAGVVGLAIEAGGAETRG